MTLIEIFARKAELEVSNEKLAEYTGIPLETLEEYLSDRMKNPSKEMIEALERVLKPPFSYGDKRVKNNWSDVCMAKEAAAKYGAACQFIPDAEGLQYKRPGEYTIDDYYKVPDEQRVELIEGYFFEMNAPTLFHQDIGGEVYYQLKQFFRKKEVPCKPFISPVDVELGEDRKTMVQPDVLIVCDQSKTENGIRIHGAPDWVLEVISPSTSRKDYIRKTKKYMESGVREYWIIDPYTMKIITYHFEKSPHPVIRNLEGMLPIEIYGGALVIDLDEVKASIEA